MNKSIINKTCIVLLFITMLFANLFMAIAQPQGASFISTSTDNVSISSASLTTAGGSFTTLILNVTQQNPRWKAYVGNVTGSLTLDDSNNFTIYNWNLATISGEVYTSRNSSLNWANVACADSSIVIGEDISLNLTSSKVDSINRTFVNTSRIHKRFYVGTTLITNSTCRAITTYVNDTAQTVSEDASFQEVLLQDGSNLVYATLLEQDAEGYSDGKTFDFQMIVAEDEYLETPTTYYFYAEISD
jgi:hypothetical protein